MTNYPAPYRVDFFNELGKYCDLTVTYEETPEMQTHREAEWFHENYDNFREVFLKSTIKKNGHNFISLQILNELNNKYDIIVVGVYSTLTSMLAIQYMIAHKIKYFIETDGGISKSGKGFSEKVKKYLISNAFGFFSPSISSDDYLKFYGADSKKIYRYPFTSLYKKDLLSESYNRQQKVKLRSELAMLENKIVIGVGQFIYRKGWDILIKVAPLLKNVGFYIIGGKDIQEYESIKASYNVNNVYFLDFMPKEELKKYYLASDLFVLPTREDIWGLVVNEAMSYGLPVVTTDKCVAGIEMVINEKNGYIVESENIEELKNAIENVLWSNNYNEYVNIALKVASNYTIEEMAKAHLKVFDLIH